MEVVVDLWCGSGGGSGSDEGMLVEVVLIKGVAW